MYTNDDLLRTLRGPRNADLIKKILDDLVKQKQYLRPAQDGRSSIELLEEPGMYGSFGELRNLIETHAERVDEARQREGDKEFRLGLAAASGNQQEVTAYLEQGVNLNGLGPRGEPIVYHAAISGHVEVLDKLVRAGADLNAPGVKHKNILHAVLFSRGIRIVQYLLQTYSLDINVQDYNGNTLLHAAVHQGWVSIAQDLLEFSPDHLIENKKRQKPSQINYIQDFSEFGAPKKLNPEILELIKKYDEEYQRKQEIILKQISNSGSNVNLSNLRIGDRDFQDILRQLAQNPNIFVLNLSGNSLTNFSINALKTELLSKTNIIQINLDNTYIRPQTIQEIQEAISPFNRLKEMLRTDFPFYQTEHLSFVTMLVQYSDDRILRLAHEAEGWYLLHYAAYYGNALLVGCLLQRGVGIDSIIKEEFYGENQTVLHLAAGQGYAEVLQKLLQEPTSRELFHSKTTSQKTALQLAVEGQYTECTGLLLKAGDRSVSTDTLLQIAIEKEDANTFKILVDFLKPSIALVDLLYREATATIQEVMRLYKSPYEEFFKAAREGNLPDLSKCISDGMDLTASASGHSLLYVATEAHRTDACILLMGSGATFNEQESNKTNAHKGRPFNHFLSEDEMKQMRTGSLNFLTKSDESLIDYLVSRISFFGVQHDELDCQRAIARKIVKELCANEYARPVIEVLESSNRVVDIIFDVRHDHVPVLSGSPKASCFYEEGRVYVGIKRDHSELLGTLIHELTHLACYFVYENTCNPFYLGGDQEAEFKKIRQNIQNHKTTQDPEFIQPVFTYREAQYDSELIVRVPQMIMHYGQEKGEQKLTDKTKELFEFYVDHVLDDCSAYVRKRKEESLQRIGIAPALRELFLNEKEMGSVSPASGGVFASASSSALETLDTVLEIPDRQIRTVRVIELVRSGQIQTMNPQKVIGICEGYLMAYSADAQLIAHMEKLSSSTVSVLRAET